MERYTLRFIPDFDPRTAAGKLVGNPAYSDRHQEDTGYSIADWRPPVATLKKEAQFFAKLEESIVAEGVKQPLCGYSFKDGTYLKTGLSRAYIAKKHGLTVPIILSDHCGRYDDYEEVKDIEDYFNPVPENIVFDEWGFYYTHLPDRKDFPDERQLTG